MAMGECSQPYQYKGYHSKVYIKWKTTVQHHTWDSMVNLYMQWYLFHNNSYYGLLPELDIYNLYLWDKQTESLTNWKKYM